jgi:PAS domain S-box-containing protein
MCAAPSGLALPRDLAELIERQVASGRFRDAAEAVRAAFGALEPAETRDAAAEEARRVAAALAAALADAEDRLRLAEGAGRMGLWEWDLRTDEVRWSEGYHRVWGIEPGSVAPSRDAFLAAVHPADRDRVAQGLARSLERGEGWHAEFRALSADGSVRWVAGRGEIQRGPDGTPLRMRGVTFDVGERRSAEEALRARSLELETILATVPAAVWFTYDPEVRQVARNRFAAELMRVEPVSTSSFAGPSGAALSHVRVLKDGGEVAPSDLPLQRAMRGDSSRDEEYAFAFSDGSVRTILSNATALRDEAGRIVGAVSVSLDITKRKQAEEHQRLLVNELNHRVKNALAIVQSVVFQTLRTRGVDPGVQGLLEARLAALSAAHDVLTRRSWEGATIQEVVAAALAPYGGEGQGGGGPRFLADGPVIDLRPKTALALAMALHELCTNAVKYGALSAEGGRVEIRWDAVPGEGGVRFRLSWRESGGPPVAPPTRRGFGSRLIERGLAAELRGQVALSYEPSGLVCVIDAPLPAAGQAG